MSKILIHPELIKLARILYVADIDYEDNKGSSSWLEFADRAREAQAAFRAKRQELEDAGVEIWGDCL